MTRILAIVAALSAASAALVARAQPLPPAQRGASAAVASSPGQPFPGLSATEIARFESGRSAFERARSLEAGLGPLFNDSACNRCHNRKGVGGAGIQSAVMAGRLDGDAFDPLLAQGGPTIAANTLLFEPAVRAKRAAPDCKLTRDAESIPDDANVVTRRRTTPLFGLGLVDATPDTVFVELARRQPAPIRGRVARVHDFAAGAPRMGKFGWKAQTPSLHQFSGQALLFEIGLTSPEFPAEQPPFGDASWLAGCDIVPDPEVEAAEVEQMTEFMQLLAPIAPLEASAESRAGDALFGRLGCDTCHARRLTSGPSPIAALSEKTYAPYSDFLLHDMGAEGDRIAEGGAGPREMRTAPLWGLRLTGSTRLWHDGRAGSFQAAIERHDGQGARSRAAFGALSSREREQLFAFLTTL
ncbi:MAG TPA: di-heme oxidoredictase family protein [Polyangiaceae bacterium]|nr:di-heme oxidoredictase family protein [Polyangiaceae bacterium]